MGWFQPRVPNKPPDAPQLPERKQDVKQIVEPRPVRHMFPRTERRVVMCGTFLYRDDNNSYWQYAGVVFVLPSRPRIRPTVEELQAFGG